MAEFTRDWFGRYTAHWSELFASRGWHPETPRTIIEIGSYEGRSALWMLENLLQHPDEPASLRRYLPRSGKPRQLLAALRGQRPRLAARQQGHCLCLDLASLPRALRRRAATQADFIYVDGSHRAAEVLEDLVLAFHAIRVGGVIICDDYLKGAPAGDLTLGSPKVAVDAFTTIYRDRLDIPWGQPLYQLAMIKTAERIGDDPGARGGIA